VIGPKAPRKPRLHDPRCVRYPAAPLRNGVLRFTADRLLERLQDRQLPPALAAIVRKPKRDRANRCDGLESIWAVVACLLAFMSIKSLRVGYRQPRGRTHDLVGLSVRQIGQWCGLDESTVSHVLTILRRAGYVHGPSRDGVNHISQPWETLASGQLAPLPAVRRFAFAFFADLGVGDLLAKVRAGAPAPAAAATVHPESASKLVAGLAAAKGLDPPI